MDRETRKSLANIVQRNIKWAPQDGKLKNMQHRVEPQEAKQLETQCRATVAQTDEIGKLQDDQRDGSNAEADQQINAESQEKLATDFGGELANAEFTSQQDTTEVGCASSESTIDEHIKSRTMPHYNAGFEYSIAGGAADDAGIHGKHAQR